MLTDFPIEPKVILTQSEHQLLLTTILDLQSDKEWLKRQLDQCREEGDVPSGYNGSFGAGGTEE